MKLNGIYHIATFGAGFYVGYNHGLGIEIDYNIENTLKYGPVILSASGSLIMTKVLRSTSKFMKKKLYNEDFDTILKDGSKINYKNLSPEQKLIQKEKLNNALSKLEKTIEKHPYVESAVMSGGKTALITFMGYAAGKLISQIN